MAKKVVDARDKRGHDDRKVIGASCAKLTVVIPEAAKRLSGIHKHGPGVWIPDSRFAASGMTTVSFAQLAPMTFRSSCPRLSRASTTFFAIKAMRGWQRNSGLPEFRDHITPQVG